MIKTFTLDLDEDYKLTEAQLREVREAAKRPPVYDPENPPLTEEQLKNMRRVGMDPFHSNGEHRKADKV